ncbi:DUF5991 domain-containing protein, partial [Lachnospiraceae bacterium OttesenSCG-928-D06]|nr:DUF5991 domain-containing protein [Lachnospiraceae bacterium OttesenSCG-928-D06]
RALYLTIIILGVIMLFIVAFKLPNNKDEINFEMGNYTFDEYLPPNQYMAYSIILYEENGLYAKIQIDGFHTLKRLNTKVWIHGNEMMFIFLDNYTDEDGNATIPDIYSEGDILLKLKQENDVITTEWIELQPMMDENKKEGQYFVRITE